MVGRQRQCTINGSGDEAGTQTPRAGDEFDLRNVDARGPTPAIARVRQAGGLSHDAIARRLQRASQIGTDLWRWMKTTHALDDMRREDHDPGTDDRALVKIDSVLIDHADASG
jgi:hypothetical protein